MLTTIIFQLAVYATRHKSDFNAEANTIIFQLAVQYTCMQLDTSLTLMQKLTS